ncbi:MAG: LEA type 2 family protein [Proteobacteria bacterium]|mgnify:CR=1 FL=1|jgi:LEA14-like dessication related protein|nr:LEA type 2 family protein [Pseudomonadota bacterium]MBK7116111.1 LEA type 2 family protein [Pseudomonadota bacterium]MBK9251716.1 LEA type 2 family protein [Pseudomonadota bacterium]
MNILRHWLPGLLALALCGCATLPDPVNVSVAGIDSLPGEGLELRMLVKLRVQNPNAVAVPFKGASVQMEVQQRAFATGVMNTGGTLPALGETVVEVPVTISAWNIIRQVMGAMDGQSTNRIQYSMSGKLHTGGLGGIRFGTEGVMEAPAAWRSP